MLITISNVRIRILNSLSLENLLQKEKFEERKQLAILVSGNNNPENWMLSKSPTDFFILKGYVQLLLDKLGLNTTEKALEDARFSDAF